MVQRSATATGITICPYCGQPIGQQEHQQILRKEKEQSDEQRAALKAEIGDAYKLEIEDAEEKSRILAEQLEQAHEAEAKVPELVEERLSAERERITAEAEKEAKREAEELRKSLHLRDEKLERSEQAAESLRKQLQESRSPQETGGLAEEELARELSKIFPRDEVTRISKGKSGADVLQKVMDEGIDCGAILYECKDAKTFSPDWVAKLATDKTEYGAAYALLVSTAQPKESDGFTVVNGIPVVHPRFVFQLVPIVREALVQAKRAEVSGEGSGHKLEELIIFLNGPGFTDRMKGMTRAITGLETIQRREKRAHDKNWKEQSKMHALANKQASDVETEITKILVAR